MKLYLSISLVVFLILLCGLRKEGLLTLPRVLLAGILALGWPVLLIMLGFYTARR